MTQADQIAPRVLLLEDEKNVGSTLAERLEQEAFSVQWAKTVEEARAILGKTSVDLALLDLGLPDGSGFDVAQMIRDRHPATAVIFLTARGNPEDRIQGLELGAEDYIVKPFHLKELILRIRNGLRRAAYLGTRPQTLEGGVAVGKARIFFERFEIESDGRTQRLSHKEASLLKLLVERRGTVVSRDEILDRAWSEDEFPTPRTIDNFVMRLRRLVEINPESPEAIKSVRGVGYLLQ